MSSDNVNSREDKRSDNAIQASQLPQGINQIEMDTIEDLRRKLQSLEKINLELNHQRVQEIFRHEKEIIKLKLEIQRGEDLHRRLESALSFARQEARIQMYCTENELYDVKSKVSELQVLSDKYQQIAAETEKMVQSAQRRWEEEQQRFSEERDTIHKVHLSELEYLFIERFDAETASKKTNVALQRMERMLKNVEVEQHSCCKMLKVQASRLDFKNRQQERLIQDLKAAAVKIKELEDNAAAARLAHIDCKYTTEFMQLRIQELETILRENQLGTRGFPRGAWNNSRESENAQQRGKKGSRRQHSSPSVQWKDQVEGRNKAEESSETFMNPPESFSLQEGSIVDRSILLNLYQSMADAHVLAKQTNAPLEELPWTEFCALLHENVEALIMNFHNAKERISHLEYTCKHQADAMNELQQSQKDAFEKMSEQLKAQEHWWQKEKQYLEQQYSNVLAEVRSRAQECEEKSQKNRGRLYGLEQNCEKLAQENNSMKDSLLDAFKARSSLLAACALLSGALCPFYGRLNAVSCQRDILQEQVNQHQLLNQKIIRLLYALPTIMERNQDEGRLRQRRAKSLVYVFRRAVIAVLATNRLRALARYSCTFFVWTDGSRGSNGIQVCVGESRGRHHPPRFGEGRVDCDEAVGWLTSSNLCTAIVTSISELEGALIIQDPGSWLSKNSLISAARNCFAKLMDNLSVLMEPVQGNICGCRAYMERDSLIQRLARGLHRANAQALEAGLYDRLPSTRNIAILQQEIFEFSRRLHASEAESHSLHLQLSECRWAFNEVQKDAEKAQSLQKQLNELQHRLNKDNIQEELDKALQREHEARLLLEEQQRRLQELMSSRGESQSFDIDKSQVSDLSLMSLPNTTEELRKRDQALNHLKKLVKDMEQDQQQLWDTLEEAELALDQGVKDKELIINHMKAVEAALNEAKEQAMASSAAAAAPLPSLQLETLPEEATAGRPEAASFQHVLRNFVDLYSLASSKVEALTGRDSPQFQFQPITAVEALTPSEDQSQGEPRKAIETSSGSDAVASMPSGISHLSPGSDSVFRMPSTITYTVSGSDAGASMPPGITYLSSGSDSVFRMSPSRTDSFSGINSISTIAPSRSHTLSGSDSVFRMSPNTSYSFPGSDSVFLMPPNRTYTVSGSDSFFSMPSSISYPSSGSVSGYSSMSPNRTYTVSDSGSSMPSSISYSSSGSDSGYFSMSPNRTYTVSGSDSGSSMPSSISYPSSGSDSGYFSMSPNRTYTVSGSDLSADSFRHPQGPISPRGPIPAGDALRAPPARAPLPSPLPPAGPSAFLFQPQGASTPRGPPPDGHWGGPMYRTYTVSGSDSGSSMPSSISYSSSGNDSIYFSMSPSRSHTVSGSDSVYFSMSPNAGTPGQVLSG